MNNIIASLREALNETKKLTEFLRGVKMYSYIHTGNLESEDIAEALSVYTKVHPHSAGPANSTHTACGIIRIPLSHKDYAIELIRSANTAREKFGALYAEFNATHNRANKALVSEVAKTSFAIPYLTKGQLISIKQIKRQISVYINPARISLYQEPLKRVEKVSEDKVNKILENLSQERQNHFNNLMVGSSLSKLRFVYSNGNYRYRANIMTTTEGEDKWLNTAISMPIIVISDEAIGLSKISDSTKRVSIRKDTQNFTPVLKEVNLYVESK